MRRRWRIGLPRHVRTPVTRLAHSRRSANQIACALISMMAGSTCSNQRPDTLMQDRITRIAKTSCTARPDHTNGSIVRITVAQHWQLVLLDERTLTEASAFEVDASCDTVTS